MADYQRIVEYLRDIRQGPLQNVTDEITHAAAEYAALCVSANERLRKCSTYLQQGLRTEAIHLADEPPNLLDLVASLDLPDPQIWSEFCQNNGLAVAPPLQLDRAALLNDAYSQDQPLEHLMAEHRTLALSRAPVAQRLGIMRRISQIDGANANWEKDIRTFEKARLKELPTAFLNAVKTRDETAMSSLMTELTQTTWLEPAPADLINGVSDAYNRMQRASVEIELQELVPPLRDAFAARSLKECQAIAQVWKNKMAAVGVTGISQELTDEIRPVVAFIAEGEKREEYLKRFRNSCKAFEGMLDRDAADSELEMGYNKLKQFNEPIPETITARYHQKDSLRQKSAERSHKLRLVGIGSTVAAVLIVALITVWILMRGANAGEWAKKIQSANILHSADGLAKAQAYIDDLHKNNPSFLTEATVAAAVRDTQAQQANFTRDKAIVDGLLEDIARGKAAAGPVAANATATPEETLIAAGTAQEVLDKAHAAGDLTWADGDKKLATEIIGLQNIFNSLSSRSSTAVRSELEKLSAKFDGVPQTAGTAASMTQADSDLTSISSRLTEFKEMKGLDDDTKTSITALAQKVDERRQALAGSKDLGTDLDTIRQAATSADDLKKALAAFAVKYPNDPRTADFTDVISHADLIQSVDAWRNMSDKWGDNLAPSSGTTAQTRIDAINAYLAANPDSPMTPTALAYVDYLKHAIDAMKADGTWQQPGDDNTSTFYHLLGLPVLKDLSYMETSDHHRYFVIGDIKRKDRQLGSTHSVDFEVVDPSNVLQRITVSIDEPTKLTTDKPLLTPQAKVVRELSDSMKLIDETNWDTWGIDTIEALARNKSMNLAARAQLIQKAIETENNIAGWALGDTYNRAAIDLARQNFDKASLVDPDSLSEITQAALNRTLNAIPSAATVKEKLAAAKNALFRHARFQVGAMGVALKDDSGTFEVVPHGDIANGAALWIILPGNGVPPPPPPVVPAPAAEAPADATTATAPATTEGDAATQTATPPPPPPVPANPGRLIQIGTVANDKIVLNTDALRDVPQGSLVYITRP